MYIKNMIKNELEKDKTLATKLAQIGGFKNATPLYKFLNESDREMDSLKSLVNIVEYLFPRNLLDVMNEYFKTINPSGKLARQALEYSHFNNLSVRHELIDRMMSSGNSESKEWATLYEIFKTLSKDPLKSMDVLNVLKTKTIEMTAFKLIMQLYCCYYLDNLHMVELISRNCDSEISKIKNDYINENYRIRLLTVICVLNLDKNELIKSRQLSFRLLEICNRPQTFGAIYQNIGMTYLYEDYEKGEEYLQKALWYYRTHKIEKDGNIHSSLNIHRAYWRKPLFDKREDGEVYDKHDVIMYYVRIGDKQKAIELLNTINEEELNIRDKAFHLYSRGIVYEDVKYFYESIKCFQKIGDRFYMNLPLEELRKLGIDERLLELIN